MLRNEAVRDWLFAGQGPTGILVILIQNLQGCMRAYPKRRGRESVKSSTDLHTSVIIPIRITKICVWHVKCSRTG